MAVKPIQGNNVPAENSNQGKNDKAENSSQLKNNQAKKPRKEKNDIWGRVIVGSYLIILVFIFVAGLFWSLLGKFIDLMSPIINTEQISISVIQINDAIVMIFAGGVGSLIYEIMGYLKHACAMKDFERAFIPWYFYRSIQGALLGLVFYFAVSGGVLFVTFNNQEPSNAALNTLALAAIGAMVGLFSKFAINKLYDIFKIVFNNKTDDKAADTSNDDKAVDTLKKVVNE
jgi:hypothetical protein